MPIEHRGARLARPGSLSRLATPHDDTDSIRVRVRSTARTTLKSLVVQPVSLRTRAGRSSPECGAAATRRDPRCAVVPRSGCNTIHNTRTTRHERNAHLTRGCSHPYTTTTDTGPNPTVPRHQPTDSELATPRSDLHTQDTTEPHSSAGSGNELRPHVVAPVHTIQVVPQGCSPAGYRSDLAGSTRQSAGGDA